MTDPEATAGSASAYATRINRVIDYVHANLGGDLSLDTLAKVAFFSPYHFHRLFKAETGERLNAFVRRARVERATVLLRSAPERTLSSVAPECGFGSLASFSRAFKREYGIAPSRWDRRTRLQERKIEQAEDAFPVYTVAELEAMRHDFPVRVAELRARRIAYLRTEDSYAEGAFQRIWEALETWREAEDIPEGEGYSMSWDDPDVTPAEKCRLDVARTLPDGLEVDRRRARARGVRLRTLPAMRVASAPCDGPFIDVHRVWEYLYRHWLPRSRWEPADQPAMERFRTPPEAWRRDGVVKLDAWIPVRPLRRI